MKAKFYPSFLLAAVCLLGTNSVMAQGLSPEAVPEPNCKLQEVSIGKAGESRSRTQSSEIAYVCNGSDDCGEILNRAQPYTCAQGVDKERCQQEAIRRLRKIYAGDKSVQCKAIKGPCTFRDEWIGEMPNATCLYAGRFAEGAECVLKGARYVCTAIVTCPYTCVNAPYTGDQTAPKEERS